MTFYEPVDVVLRIARALRFVREQPRNSNRGDGVDAMLALTGLNGGYPWCAAYVAWVGRAALDDGWPLPLTAGCAALGAAAERRHVLSAHPMKGDVFLLYSPTLKRFAHTGFVTDVRETKVSTIEGNTNDGGSRDGWGVFERSRTFGARDRFIRWVDVL